MLKLEKHSVIVDGIGAVGLANKFPALFWKMSFPLLVPFSFGFVPRIAILAAFVVPVINQNISTVRAKNTAATGANRSGFGSESHCVSVFINCPSHNCGCA